MKMYVCNRKDMSVIVFGLARDGDKWRLIDMGKGVIGESFDNKLDALRYLIENFISCTPLW